MRTNYVLIDYENVQPSSITTLEHECIKLIVFVGEKQSKVNIDVAVSLQRLGTRAEYLKMMGGGPNALDFHIAYYIGRLSVTEPDACFHVISKDKGFDPLVAHLKTRKVLARRWENVGEMEILPESDAKLLAGKVRSIVENLRQRGDSKPATARTLASTIHALFQKSISDAEVTSLLALLQEDGIIKITGTKVTYSLPQ